MGNPPTIDQNNPLVEARERRLAVAVTDLIVRTILEGKSKTKRQRILGLLEMRADVLLLQASANRNVYRLKGGRAAAQDAVRADAADVCDIVKAVAGHVLADVCARIG